MQTNKVVFVPYKTHQNYVISSLSQSIPVAVLTPPDKELPQNISFEMIRVKYLQFGLGFLKKIFNTEIRNIKYIKGFKNKLNKIKIQSLIVYECYHLYTFQAIFYKKRNPNINLFVLSETQSWPKNMVARILKKILFFYFKHNIHNIKGIIVYTQLAYEFTKQYLPTANVILLPTPINTQIFYPDKHRPFLLNDELRILMNARFSSYKRYQDLFEAILILIGDGKKIKVTCISRYENDRKKIYNLAEQKGVSDFVQIVGPLPQSDLADLYKQNDLLVLPSEGEAIGLVVPEAMACGTPTVTSDTVGANVYVINQETGLIFKSKDVGNLANTLKKLFNRHTLEMYSINSQNHIRNNYHITKYVNTFLEKIYNI